MEKDIRNLYGTFANYIDLIKDNNEKTIDYLMQNTQQILWQDRLEEFVKELEGITIKDDVHKSVYGFLGSVVNYEKGTDSESGMTYMADEIIYAEPGLALGMSPVEYRERAYGFASLTLAAALLKKNGDGARKIINGDAPLFDKYFGNAIDTLLEKKVSDSMIFNDETIEKQLLNPKVDPLAKECLRFYQRYQNTLLGSQT